MTRPKFTDLNGDQQRQFGNGVGPSWLPNWTRALITQRPYLPISAPLAVLISIVFYRAVRIFGQFGSFRYSDQYPLLDEVLDTFS